MAVIIQNQSTFAQVKGTSNGDLAQKWIDFVLSPAGQAVMQNNGQIVAES